jgi:integration host factor subunit beta
MMKANLIKEIARVVEMPQREAQIVLEVILGGMVRALRKGERVELRGFGIFGTHVRAWRIARNPRTGAQVNVPARRVPHFKAGKELLALLNTSADATERQG